MKKRKKKRMPPLRDPEISSYPTQLNCGSKPRQGGWPEEEHSDHLGNRVRPAMLSVRYDQESLLSFLALIYL